MNCNNLHLCNNINTVQLTYNSDYNLFYEYVKGIVYLYGVNTLIKLNGSSTPLPSHNHLIHNNNNNCNNNDNFSDCNSIYSSSMSTPSIKPYQPSMHHNSHIQHIQPIPSHLHHLTHHTECIKPIIPNNNCNVNNTCSEESDLCNEMFINSEMFKFVGVFTSLCDINNLQLVCDLSIALLKKNNNIEIYLYSTEKRKYLIAGWNNIGYLFTKIDVINTTALETILTNPTILKNENIFDMVKFKNGNHNFQIPNTHYILNFTKYIVNNTSNNITNYFTIIIPGTYIITYNISWFFTLTGDTSNSHSVLQLPLNSELAKMNDAGILIFIIRIFEEDVIDILYTSIKQFGGFNYPSNSSHSFKTQLNSNERICMVLYNLYTNLTTTMNIINEGTYVSIKKII